MSHGRKAFLSVVIFASALAIAISCGDSDTTARPGSAYADFGVTLESSIPAGFKTGGAGSRATLNSDSMREAPGCRDSRSCLMTTSSSAGELFMKIWAMDYENECTDALVTAGTCFQCPACNANSGTYYKKPLMLSAPETCPTAETTGSFVNFGIDPCRFDIEIAQVDNFATCAAGTGTTMDITTVVPWAATWSVPTSITFLGYSNGLLWNFVDGDAANGKYFVQADTTQVFAGIKDVSNNFFMYFGVGATTTSFGETGPNLNGYAGTLTGDRTFETIQIRNQTGDRAIHRYINRVKSNAAGTHVYMQQWSDDGATRTAGANDLQAQAGITAAKAAGPDSAYCALLGETVATSTFVELSVCITAFGHTTQAELDDDDNYYFKLIPMDLMSTSIFQKITSADSSTCDPAAAR